MPPPIVAICATTVAIVTASYIPYTFLSVLAEDVSIRSAGLAALQIGYDAAELMAVALIGRLLDTRIRVALALVTGGLAGVIVARLAATPLFCGANAQAR